MFTTLTEIKCERKNAAERMHFVKKRKYLSEFRTYGEYGFYVTRLCSYCADNTDSIEKFKVRAAMPVITDASPEVKKYRLIVEANTVFALNGAMQKIAVFDPYGELTFLLPFLAQKTACIYVYTHRENLYRESLHNIYKSFGTPIITVNKINALNSVNAVFSLYIPPVNRNRIYGAENIYPELLLTNNIKRQIPDYCNPYYVAAGLYFYGNKKELGSVCQSRIRQ